MKKRQARSGAFRDVFAAISRGEKVKCAAAAEGVNLSSYYKWLDREGLAKVKGPEPSSAQFKAAEREYRALPTLHEICAKHGITRRQLYSWRYLTGGLPK